MKFRTIPNFRLTDLSLYHIIVLLGHGAFVLRAQQHAHMPDKQQRSLLGRLIMEEYTHTTGDMQRRAAEIVGEFLADIFGEELRPWEENGKMEKELSA